MFSGASLNNTSCRPTDEAVVEDEDEKRRREKQLREQQWKEDNEKAKTASRLVNLLPIALLWLL